MSTFYIEASSMARAIVKVEAENFGSACEVATDYFVDDFNNAGPLRFADVTTEDAVEEGVLGLDASIISRGAMGWDYADDDPVGRGEA